MDLEKGIVRVLGPDGATAGAGFLVRGSDGVLRILTCSHVLLDPVTQGKEAPRPERAAVAFLADAKDALPREATIESWVPYADGDIAVLRLEGDPPEEAEALPLGSAEHAPGQPFKTFGFPPDTPSGMVAEGAIRALVDSRIQLGEANEITPGFSGAPLLAVKAGRVVGMVVSIRDLNRYGRGPETAFAIPFERIREACRKLEPDDVCPYLGLAAFTQDDARFFFGQDATIERLERELAPSPRALAVLGPSGSGKSSLVRAGLLPRLEAAAREGRQRSGPAWEARVIRPADALTGGPGSGRGPSARPRACVDAWRMRAPDERRLLLVVDQFEELLAHEDAAARDGYLAELLAIIDEASLAVCTMLVMRSDFYGRLSEMAPLPLERLAGHKVDLPAWLGRKELEVIVREPAGLVGLGFEQGLVEDIVKAAIEVAPVGGVDDAARSTVLPLLEAALTGLWEKRSEGLLTHDGYEHIGELTGALPRQADDAYRRLKTERQLVARRVLTNLVHVAPRTDEVPDSRWRRARSELVALAGAGAEGVVDDLARERLVVIEGEGREATVELIHDVLIREWWPGARPKGEDGLRQWVDKDRAELLLGQKISEEARDWDAGGRTEDLLALRGGRLEDAGALAGRRGALNDLEADYVRAALDRDQRERERELAQERQVTEAERQRALAEQGRADAAERAAKAERERAAEAERATEAERQRAEAEAKGRGRQRQLSLALGVLAIVALVVLVVTKLALDDAKDQREVSDVWRVAGQAETERLRGRPGLSALLARYAYELSQKKGGVAAASVDRAMRATVGAEPFTRELPVDAGVVALAFGPDGKLTAGLERGRVMSWPLAAPGAPYMADSEWAVAGGVEAEALAYNEAGREWLAVGKNDDSIVVWCRARTDQGMTLPVDGSVRSVAMNVDGTRIAAALGDRVAIWDLSPTGSAPDTQPIEGCRSYASTVAKAAEVDGVAISVALSADGAWLVAGGVEAQSDDDPDVLTTVWHWDTREATPDRWSDAPSAVLSLAVANNGRLAAGLRSGRVFVAGPREDGTELQFGGPVTSVAFGPDGLLAAGSGGTVRVWDAGLDTLFTAPNGGGKVSALAFSQAEPGSMLASGGSGDSVRVWSIGPAPEPEVLDAAGGGFGRVAVSPEGLIASDAGGGVKVWRDQGDPDPVTFPAGYNTAVALGPGGRLAVATPGTVTIWDSDQTARQPDDRLPIRGLAYGLAFGPNGEWLVAAGASNGDDGSIWLWRLTEDDPVRLDARIKGSVRSAAISPDGRWLAVGSAELGNIEAFVGHIAVYGLEAAAASGSLTPRWTCDPPGSWILSVAFSPEGWLAAGGGDGTVRVWKPERSYEGSDPTCDSSSGSYAPWTRPMGSKVEEVAFSPDGDWLAAGSRVGMVRLWPGILGEAASVDIDTGNGLTDIAFGPTGEWLAVVNDDDNVRIWATPDRLAEFICEIVGRRTLDRKDWEEFVGSGVPGSICADAMAAATMQP